MYFITSAIVCSIITVIILNLSFNSQVVAMADNVAYITSINASVYNYTCGVDEYTATNPVIKNDLKDSYNPLADFNEMMNGLGVMISPATTVVVTWDGKKTIVQYGGFVNTLGSTIIPHQQESIIEND